MTPKNILSYFSEANTIVGTLVLSHHMPCMETTIAKSGTTKFKKIWRDKNINIGIQMKLVGTLAFLKAPYATDDNLEKLMVYDKVEGKLSRRISLVCLVV